MAKKRGRPPKPDGTTVQDVLQIRIATDDKALWARAAAKAGISLSDWMRDHLNRHAKRELRP